MLTYRERGLEHHRYGRDDRHSPSLKTREWDPEYAEREWNRRQEWETRDNWDIDMKHATEEEWRLYNAGRSMEAWPEERRRWPAADWRESRDHSRPRSVASHSREADLDSRRKEHARADTHSRNDPPARSERTERNHSLPRSEASHETQSRKESSHDSHGRAETQHSKPDRERERKEPAEKKESVEKKEIVEKKESVQVNEPESETPSEPRARSESEEKDSSLKRPAEQPLDSPSEPKKMCLEPVLEDDLSEISDDADEILNRVEEVTEEPEEEVAVPENTETSSLKEQTSAASQKSQSPPRSPANRLSKENSIDEENMDLDFEEISEDELEEESRVKGIGDALGVDWASLVAESRPRVKPLSSAKKRWESHNVLYHLGISVELAGEDFVKEVYREHEEAELIEKMKIKVENEEKNGKMDSEITSNEARDDPNKDLLVTDPLAEIQVANLEKMNLRRTLLTSVGPYRRALSARRDLMIRRNLCNLPISDAFVEAPKRHDPELFKLAVKLLERGKDGEKGTL